jgi:hypothetical protein
MLGSGALASAAGRLRPPPCTASRPSPACYPPVSMNIMRYIGEGISSVVPEKAQTSVERRAGANTNMRSSIPHTDVEPCN